MARTKSKPATPSKKWTPFKSKNKLGRDGHRRARFIKLPNSNLWASLRVALRRRVRSRELYLRICNYIKTTSHLLINTAEQNVLVEAGWVDQNRITNLIHRYLPGITISKVMRVNNPYIAAMYDLKKEEYRSRGKAKHGGAYVGPPPERELFHSTSQYSVGHIVEDNLNWRFVHRAKFGQGNCFSSDADYANCHANRHNGENRAFIICQVLVQDKTLGCQHLQIPPNGYDTTTGGSTNEIVYVKFSDNEFMPQFVAYYKCDYQKDVFGSKYNNLPRNWF